MLRWDAVVSCCHPSTAHRRSPRDSWSDVASTIETRDHIHTHRHRASARGWRASVHCINIVRCQYVHKLEELATELPQRAKAHNKWDRRQTNESVRPGESLRHVGCYSAKGGWGSRKMRGDAESVRGRRPRRVSRHGECLVTSPSHL